MKAMMPPLQPPVDTPPTKMLRRRPSARRLPVAPGATRGRHVRLDSRGPPTSLWFAFLPFASAGGGMRATFGLSAGGRQKDFGRDRAWGKVT